MGWSIGFDNKWQRDIGYGVPSFCDHPKCNEKIDRGLSYVCGSDPMGGEFGCGLYFCEKHFKYRTPRAGDYDVAFCPRCYNYKPPYNPKPDHPEWINFKITDESWAKWRKQNNLNE